MINEHDDDYDSVSDEPDEYFLSENDKGIVGATKLLLRKIARLPSIRPREMEVVAKVLGVFERLPRVSDELNAVIDLTGPRHHFGEHEIWHWWGITVAGNDLQVSSGGHFYRPSSGGDSFSCMQWQATPGYETFYEDYLDTLQIVDDAQPYDTEVARLTITEPGYRLSIELDGEQLESSYECQGCGMLFGDECVTWDEEAQCRVAVCPGCGNPVMTDNEEDG